MKIYSINKDGLTIDTFLLFRLLKKELNIDVLMYEKLSDKLLIYHKNDTNFLKLKKFILDTIPNVKTVIKNRKHSRINKFNIIFLSKIRYN